MRSSRYLEGGVSTVTSPCIRCHGNVVILHLLFGRVEVLVLAVHPVDRNWLGAKVLDRTAEQVGGAALVVDSRRLHN